jgi:GH18 family chitinase
MALDSEEACQAKVRYARDHALGGLMIWQLAHGHRLDLPPGRRDPLLQAIKQSLASPLPSRKDTAIN